MNNEIWQQLISLESHDVIKKWYKKIHSLKLNNRRSLEISSAFKQAREYFSNASKSDYSVRPLLTFYGISSLSRLLTLLFSRNGGEDKLVMGHGLETKSWKNSLSGNINTALQNIGSLKVTTRNGLFTDLINSTSNNTCLHVRSSVVDWRVNYDIPSIGNVIILHDLLSRIPDLETDISNCFLPKYLRVNDISYNEKDGYHIKVSNSKDYSILTKYENYGYQIMNTKDNVVLNASKETFNKYRPFFAHKYINKTFGSIPTLYIVEPFENGDSYSEICVVYILSYYLGMLVRYYPTQWISLINGQSGDMLRISVKPATDSGR